MSALRFNNKSNSKQFETYSPNESEKKRLESVKQKKKQFRAKEQVIQSALKNLDNTLNKNKIIFDDNLLDQSEEPKFKPKLKQKKKHLFDDDENEAEDKEAIWNNSDFDVEKKHVKHIITLGNDERFKLDKRFMDDGSAVMENNSIEKNDVCDLEKEKEWQLDILGNVLGVPITSRNKDQHEDTKPTKKRMIRYDPTENDHKAYEILPEKLETDDKKVKKKEKTKVAIIDGPESAPVQVSKDTFFTVSDSLTKSLKDGGQFSLLKTYAKEENMEKSNKDHNTPIAENIGNKKLGLNFSANNSFVYDSTEDANENAEEYNEKLITNNDDEKKQVENNPDQFFFNDNDIRFNEAASFFSEKSIPGDEFRNLRQELKQIVRSKIRHNLKKNALWGGKRKVKKLK